MSPTDPLGEQSPMDTALFRWLVENGHVSYGGLVDLRAALTTESVLLGFAPSLFDAREQLLGLVDWAMARVEDQVRQFNLDAGLSENGE